MEVQIPHFHEIFLAVLFWSFEAAKKQQNSPGETRFFAELNGFIRNIWKSQLLCFLEILTAWVQALLEDSEMDGREVQTVKLWWKLGGSDHLRSMSPSLVIKYMCNKIVIRHDLINLQGLSPNKCLALNGMCYLVGARHGGPRVVRVVHIFFLHTCPAPTE